jgi:hypothetical protein
MQSTIYLYDGLIAMQEGKEVLTAAFDDQQ